MAYESIHRKLYEHVEEAIGLRIIKGEFSPNDKLPNEDMLCAEFGVSRGVIREAVRVLHKKGFVSPRPKIGTLVQPKSKWNLFDPDVLVWKLKEGQQLEFLRQVTEVRTIIESEAAGFSAARATEEDINKIQRCYHRLADVLKERAAFSYAEYLKVDMAFHTAILEASHNELLAQIGRTMRFAVQTARQADIRDFSILLASQPHHAAVVTAIVGRDVQSALSASREMFDRVWENIPANHAGESTA